MAGSQRYFKYTTDTNEDYSVVVDESNAEALIGADQCMPNRTASHPYLPKGCKMRYILAETIGTRRIQRRFYIGDTTLLLGVTSGTTILAKAYPDSAVEDWVVVSYNGEKVKFVKPLLVASGDTGLNDGDQGRDEIDA